MSEAVIVPLAIKGSWRIYEIDKKIHSAEVKLQILPPILPTDEIYKDKMALASYLHSQISQACLLYTSPCPRDRTRPSMPSSA